MRRINVALMVATLCLVGAGCTNTSTKMSDPSQSVQETNSVTEINVNFDEQFMIEVGQPVVLSTDVDSLHISLDSNDPQGGWTKLTIKYDSGRGNVSGIDSGEAELTLTEMISEANVFGYNVIVSEISQTPNKAYLTVTR